MVNEISKFVVVAVVIMATSWLLIIINMIMGRKK